jgi:hypothetical protein
LVASCYDPVLVEIPAAFRRTRLRKGPLGFRPAMDKPVFRGLFGFLLPQRPFPGVPQIDDVAHGLTRPQSDPMNDQVRFLTHLRQLRRYGGTDDVCSPLR